MDVGWFPTTHHDVVMLIKLNSRVDFAEGVGEIIFGGGFFVENLFFFSPLKDDKVFHINVARETGGLLRIGEFSGAVIVSKDCGREHLSDAHFMEDGAEI